MARTTLKTAPPGSASAADTLAFRIGQRLKQARLGAGLTQQQLAGDRYTKAYVSALENSLVKPSMKALDYLATRLGTTASQLMANEQPAWTRMEADLQLAAGKWLEAADAYTELLESSPDRGVQAELLRGKAEALARLDRGAEAAAAASRAVELFEGLGREVDAAIASYWLSAGLFYQDNVADSKAILQALLGKVRAGLKVEPDFRMRVLMALSSTEAREGNNKQALSYLEQVRSLADELDERRRATFLMDLAHNYCLTGDYEGALRAGYASLALFAASDTKIEMGRLENELAMAHLGAGNAQRAADLAADARRHFEELADDRHLAHVMDTEAQIAGARGDWTESLRLANDAREAGRKTKNPVAEGDALTTAGKAHAALGDTAAAESAFEEASAIYRKARLPGQLRRVLTEWADVRANAGNHEGAFALTREALRSTA
jgi:transcriptional regulator with XRE-family HTH domain